MVILDKMVDKLPLLPQQSLMLGHMKNASEAAVFASPGLGKTRAVLEFVRDWVSDGGSGALIIAPLRVARLTWPAEVAKWAPDLRVADLRTEEGREKWKRGAADLYLCNIEYLQQMEQLCLADRKELPADILVLDELSKFKEVSGKRYKSLFRHIHKFRRRLGLTGTPGSHLELFGQIKILDAGNRLGKFITAYKRDYFYSDFLGYNFTLKVGAKEEIEARIADMVITLRGDEYLTIPPVHFIDLDIVLPPAIMSGYQKLQKEFLLQLAQGDIVAPTAAAKLSKLLQYASGAVYTGDRKVLLIHEEKLKALKKLHDGLGRPPMLVLTQFIHERERILAAIPYAEEFSEKRLDAWNRGEIKMLVADARSISLGLNLQGPCHHLAWFSLTYSSESYRQANGRIARTGQTKECFIYRIMVERSADWSVAEALRSKQEGEEGLMLALAALKMLGDG